jgi:hypothetical protein
MLTQLGRRPQKRMEDNLEKKMGKNEDDLKKMKNEDDLKKQKKMKPTSKQ